MIKESVMGRRIGDSGRPEWPRPSECDVRAGTACDLHYWYVTTVVLMVEMGTSSLGLQASRSRSRASRVGPGRTGEPTR